MLGSALTEQILQLTPKSIGYFQIFSTFLIGGILIGISIFLKYALRRHAYSKKIPGCPVSLFNLLGNIAEIKDLSGDTSNFNVAILRLIGKYTELFRKKKLFCLWVSYAPFIILIKAEALEELISGNKTLKKGWSYNFLHPWLGTGLLTSFGPKWKSRRKLLTPSFHFEILKDFLPVFNDQSQKFAKILHKETTKEFTDIVMPVTLCSLDIICETTLGVSIGAQDDKNSDYVNAVLRAANTIAERAINCRYWFEGYFRFTEEGKQNKKDLKLLHNFTNSVIREKKEKLLSSDPATMQKKKRKALLDVLLEHHVQTKQLTQEDIREEVDTFAFEGHDTTSMGISWALYLMGLHKDVQEKVHEEMDRIFGSDTERHVTTDDLKDMEYLERVLKESQRLYPSVPFFAREATDDLNICGYQVAKGTQCVAMTYFVHRDPDVFPDPEKFDPDRFLPENSSNRHPFAYIPFSAGPRNCIGQRFAIMEEKVVVSSVMRNFTLESLDSRDVLTPAAELILRSPIPIRIKIRPRKFD